MSITLQPTTSQPTLVELVRLVGEGDTGAETAIVERFSRGLRTYIRRLRCSPDQADDLHQDTFRIVLERLRHGSLQEPEGLAGFLRGTARRLHLDAKRKAARRRTEPDEIAISAAEDPKVGQLREVLDAEAANLVRRLLDDLEPPRDREILYRFYIAEDQKESICEDLGLSSLHFNRVLFRARRRFKQLVSGFDELQRVSHA